MQSMTSPPEMGLLCRSKLPGDVTMAHNHAVSR